MGKKKAAKKEAKKSLLETRLAALPADAGEKLPGMPVSTAIEEAYLLAKRAGKLRKQMVALPGFDAGALDGLDLITKALKDAEDRWRKTRLDQQDKSLKKTRKEAEQLRAEVIAAGRYLLRHDERAQRELDQIAEGEGLADLIQDLGDLKKFWDSHQAEFAHAVGLDEESHARLGDLQIELRGGADDVGANEAQAERNRLFAALTQAMSEVRSAARYLLRGKPEKLADFTNSYFRVHNAKRRKPAAPPAPSVSGSSAPV